MSLDVQIVLGDIMNEPADVIVNPANPRLQHGGGLCGIIFDAVMKTEQGYAQLLYEIGQIPQDSDGIRCDFGNSVLTSAPGLPFKSIIHTVGAMADIHNPAEQRQILFSCYYTSITLANAFKFKSIAFPLVGCGIYGCSHSDSYNAFLAACRKFTRKFPHRKLNTVKLVILEREHYERLTL